MHNIRSVIVGTGSYIPEKIVKNDEFLNHRFYNSNKERINKTNEEIIFKFEEITGIQERRYAPDEMVTSELAYRAALDAVESSKIDRESLDYIIVAHIFGDVHVGNRRSDMVPSLAGRVKRQLGILNPKTVAYDVVFGCPGWLQSVIQADYYIRTGDAKRVMVIGSEALSRISDPSDIDSMIYSDGAGATILEGVESDDKIGILAHASRSDTYEYGKLLWMDKTYSNGNDNNELFLKMYGHKLYKYALLHVPDEMKECILKANLTLSDIDKIIIHQANEKMDNEIVTRLFKLFDINDNLEQKVEEIMPMTISWLGNSSVATLPTLFDLLVKGKITNHKTFGGGYYVFASVGAGMNVNCMIYKMP